MEHLQVTGQFADKPTRGKSSRGLVNSQTSQLAETFDKKFAVQSTPLISTTDISTLHLYAWYLFSPD